MAAVTTALMKRECTALARCPRRSVRKWYRYVYSDDEAEDRFAHMLISGLVEALVESLTAAPDDDREN